jgi:RecJ-like exonuclease
VVSHILTHGDCDGICSGSLFLAAHPDAKIFFTNPYGLYEDLQRIPSGSYIAISDVALNLVKLPEIMTELRRINSEGKIVYVDHHPFPKNLDIKDIPGTVIHNTEVCASELVFQFLRQKISKDLSRVAIYGAIGDYSDNTPLILELLRDWDKRTLYFETGILVQGVLGSRKEYDFKRQLVFELSVNRLPSKNRELVNRAIMETFSEEEMRLQIKHKVKLVGKVAYVLDVAGSTAKAAIYAGAATGAIIGMAGETRGEMIDLSVRTRDEKINLNSILVEVAPKYGGAGGGHPLAAGARVPSKNFSDFIEGINKMIER